MQNLDSKNKGLVLTILSSILALVIWVNLADPLATNAQKPSPSPEFVDPSKDFKSLDNYLTYNAPENWAKTDQVDKEGINTSLMFNSPDFAVASNSAQVEAGIKLWVNRSYDLDSEGTLKTKLNTAYPIYDYNILPLTIGGKNAMTLHEDYQGHNRFIYIAGKEHLWTITVSSKSLEEEQEYENEITNFLNSLQFKD